MTSSAVRIAAVPWLAAATAHALALRANRPPRKSESPYATAEQRARTTTTPTVSSFSSAARENDEPQVSHFEQRRPHRVAYHRGSVHKVEMPFPPPAIMLKVQPTDQLPVVLAFKAAAPRRGRTGFLGPGED